MTLARLLSDLERLNVDLWLEAGQLRFKAPNGAMSEDVRHRVSLHKAELIRIHQDASALSNCDALERRSDDDLPLSPHQRWYVSTFDPEQHAWALTVAFDAPWRVSESLLHATLSELSLEHDVLRLRLYRTREGDWAQRMLPRAEIPIAVHDLTAMQPKARERVVHEAGHRAQRSLSIINGPVLALALCRSAGEPDRIVVAVHHHVADRFSLNLLLGELLRVYQDLAMDRPRGRSDAAASYRDYLFQLHAYTRRTTVVARALAFWCDPSRLRHLPPLPVDMPDGRHTDLNSRRISMPLGAPLWQKVSSYIRARKGDSFNDQLLFGLAQAFFRWTGERSLRLDVDYQVRIGLLPGMDLLGMIGPATTKFPMLLTINPDSGAEQSLEELRLSIRETVDNALGYGFLRYTCNDVGIRERLSTCAPQVFLNNRSTLNTGLAADSAPVIRSMSFPQPGVRENPVSYDIMIECDGADDRIVVSWVYSSAIHHERTIQALATHFLASLHALTEPNQMWA